MRAEPIMAPCRRSDGRYELSLIANPRLWVIYRPGVPLRYASWSFGADDEFRRLATTTAKSFGRACIDCGYLEFEHNIDGEEKAPCRQFRVARSPRADKGGG